VIKAFLEPKKPDKKNKKNEEQANLNEVDSIPVCLNDLSLTIEKKEKIGICGLVGSGKTAFLDSILGTVWFKLINVLI
jgi:ABC-type polysaccharide/polyol phosphate transport system ATPase subunit